MRSIKYYFISAWMLLFTSCSISYNDDIIDPSATYGTARDIDPEFESNGFQDVSLISIYESYEYQVGVNRTYGVSRKLEVSLKVDTAGLQNYNKLYNTNYELLPAEDYNMPSTVTFEALAQDAGITITFYPERLATAAGIEKASDYVLPIKITTEQEGAMLDSAMIQTLLHVAMTAPTISVTVPSSINALSFINNSGLDEEVSIDGEINFTGFDAANIDIGGTQTNVDDYNASNGTDYLLLPAENYSFNDILADEEGGLLTLNGKINANGLDPEKSYLLPCKINSSLYKVEQDTPIYFTVSIVQLELKVTSGGNVVEKNTGIVSTTGILNVTMNSLISEDLSINFKYDPSLVDDYNSTNGTTYQKLPENTVSIEGAVMSGGQRSIDVPYAINTSDLVLENGVHYLVPLVLQEDDLEFGMVSGSPVTYLDITKTLLDTYNFNKISTQRERTCGNEIWPANECARAGDGGAWDAAIAKAQYGFTVDATWDKGYAMLFSVTDEDMPGKAGCKRIEIYTFLEATIDGGADGTGNKVSDNQSYFNTLTGEIYIDFTFYESWIGTEGRETYSLTR